MLGDLSGSELHDRVLKCETGWFNACREVVERAKRGQLYGSQGVGSYHLARALCAMSDRGFRYTVFEQGVRVLLEVRDVSWHRANEGESMGIAFAWCVFSDAQKAQAGRLLVELGWYEALLSSEREALLRFFPELMQSCANALK